LAVETSERTEDSDAENIKTLRDRQEKMMDELKRRIEGGPSMFDRHRYLEQLQQLVHAIAVNLETLDAEAASARNNSPSTYQQDG
jgi:flagellar biosynthesis chaperone FliJ